MNSHVVEPLPPDMLEAERERLPEPQPTAQPSPRDGGSGGGGGGGGGDGDGGVPVLALRAATTRLPGRAFGPFDVRIDASERIAVLGPSGAGKSTLLALMAGERAVQAGAIELDGRPFGEWSRPAMARRRAVLPQSHSVAFGMPVDLVVSLGRIAVQQVHAADTRHRRIVACALQAAQAGHLASRRFDTLSGGEQARVQLARVFAQLWDVQGGLLLVDEPLAALDPGLQFTLMDALAAYAIERRHAIVAVLHDINHALAGFDRLWLLREGRVVADLRADRSAVAPIEALYGIALRVVDDADGGLAVLPVRSANRSKETVA